MKHLIRPIHCKDCNKLICYTETCEPASYSPDPINHFSINMYWMDFLCEDCKNKRAEKGNNV